MIIGYQFINTEAQPFNLEFEDLREYYSRFMEDRDYEEADEVDLDGARYLVV